MIDVSIPKDSQSKCLKAVKVHKFLTFKCGYDLNQESGSVFRPCNY